MATITRKGRRFVLVPVEEYEQLIDEVLPPLPPADADGTSN
jgi:PHD/YefM family antitoxin component YafN of YafNO toxin-antitoxin module